MNVPKGISIEGMSPQDKQVIQRIGFEAWMMGLATVSRKMIGV